MIYKQYGAVGMPRCALGGSRERVRSLPQSGLCPIEE